MATAVTKPMLPIINGVAAYGSPLSGSPRRGPNRLGFNHHHRRRRGPATAAAAIATIILVIATSAWSSLVFSSSNALPLLIWRGHRGFSSWSSPGQPHSIGDPFHGAVLEKDGGSSAISASPRSQAVGSAAPGDDPLALNHIVFGIAGSAGIWHRRREFLRLWWRPNGMRGNVWMEDGLKQQQQQQLDQPLRNHNSSTSSAGDSSLPDIRVSEDISRFRYTNPTGHPSGLRIARIVAETFRLGLYGDARWFFLCDDDTIVNPDNLVMVLSKYDWREMVYVGGPSESHSANTYFSHGMAFGGGGIALSFPLAAALAEMLDDCLDRYPNFYGSDDRLHACISELGVPLSRERGFHQWDVRGNAHGLLAAHPTAPFISIHHVEAVDAFYPGLSHLESLRLFSKAMNTDPSSFLQRSICYEKRKKLTFSISLGYVIQVFPYLVLPRDLERSELTYIAWNSLGGRNEFDFDTRDSHQSLCKRPILFFLDNTWRNGTLAVGSYLRARGRDEFKRRVLCFPRSSPLPEVKQIRVLGHSLTATWHLVPRRLCSRLSQTRDDLLTVIVGECEKGSFGSAVGSL